MLEAFEDRTVPTAGSVSVATLADALEGGTDGVVRFSRTGSTSSPLTVNYSVSGTATSGDFVALTGTVTFAANAATADVEVSALKDNEFEDLEDVTITVSASVNDPYAVGSVGAASVVIADDPPQVTSTATWETGGSEIGQITLTRTGGDTSQPLTVWFETRGTWVDEDGETVTVVMAATAMFAAGETSLTIPILADANGGFANPQMPGATPVEERADQSAVLNAARAKLDEPAGAQFGATVLGLPTLIDELPGPISYPEYRALISIRQKLQSMNANNFEVATERTNILDAITAKLSLGIRWRTAPDPSLPFQGMVGGLGVAAAVITGTPDWARTVQKVNSLLAELGVDDFPTRERAEADLKDLLNGYAIRGDLTRSVIVLRLLTAVQNNDPNAEVRTRATALCAYVKNSIIFMPEKRAAIAAVVGGWINGIGEGP